MRITLAPLKRYLEGNVCEVLFIRRIPLGSRPPVRRMLCTNSLSLLMSPEGRTTLNFRPARGVQPYNPTMLKLIVTWDIFCQDYRQINMERCELINKIPEKEFWNYFNAKIKDMTTAQKMTFMDLA